MCGIVGYIGKRDAMPVLIGGLKRLEYRGYDSAGVVVIDNDGHSHLTRSLGRVASLEEATSKKKIEPTGIGIAHTRWATHGIPSENNAHPHSDCSDSFWIIHNGIIENYKELKEKLVLDGHNFQSDTDTEVLAHLIEESYEKTKNEASSLLKAVRKALEQVEGAYGLAVISRHEPDKIIAARNSSPLIIGIGDGEYFVASDASAVVSFTKSVIYLNDGEIAEITESGHVIENIGKIRNKQLQRTPETIDWDIENIEKNGHAHFMHKEIFEIPETIINSTRGRLIVEDGLAKLGGIENFRNELRNIKRILISACGTASYAGRVGEYMLEEYAGIPTEVDIASELRYRKPVFEKDTLLIAISQSGETADTLAVIKEAKEKGIPTMGIVNAVGSTIARETGFGIYNHAGPEISVASTKAFVSQVTVLALLTIFLGRQRDMSLVTGKRIAEEILMLPQKIEKVLAEEEKIKIIAKKYYQKNNFMCLGRKYNYPIALETALKLKEICYVQAEGIPSGEIKHGSIALIDKDFPSFIVAPKDSMYQKSVSNIEEIKARGGPIIAVTTEGNKELEGLADDIIYIPKTLEMLTPILSAIPGYLFSYHIAVARGNDIDKPRNLAKSVTVE